MNDVIIQTSIEHNERWTRFTQHLSFVWAKLTQWILPGVWTVDHLLSSFLYTKHLSVSLEISSRHNRQSRAHLAVSTERVLFPTNKDCLCKSISPFTSGLHGSPYAYTIHVALMLSHPTHTINYQLPTSSAQLPINLSQCLCVHGMWTTHKWLCSEMVASSHATLWQWSNSLFSWSCI